MGDALCGPSNALQNFQKHASTDRTLQQDRLTTRHSANQQGFRSQNPHDGILDPEFAAFEANHGGPPLQDLQHPAHFRGPAQLPHAPYPTANWASDFQNLHISGPSAPQVHTPPVAQAPGGWHQEFLKQQQQQPTPAQHMQAQPMANRGFQPTFAPSYGAFNTPMNMQQQMPQNTQQSSQAPSEQFDDAAFEAAFDQARANLEHLLESEVSSQTETSFEEMSQADPGTVLPDEVLEPEIRIGSDRIGPGQVKEDPLERIHDNDALAQTAGQLIDNLRHEQSKKFKESSFMELMRRVRDREVEVEGEHFREVSNNT
ncbi:hypothetical protein N7532_006261 [Penicillium argentinense]|uniref:Peroxin 20 n=1 Tax=Penicillium argentinense TaxID=1131581 RepID=A0A9W9FFG6_9EURO|nr:uncharacterized protein N7532_006261 [Penicillium argentinense]KAJ5099260.1 hypothetical protein N7532_006261 [Penicillium argentinense]